MQALDGTYSDLLKIERNSNQYLPTIALAEVKMSKDQNVNKGTVSMYIYHPLLNVPLPTVADLRSRCSDSESVEVLDVACQLAAMRCCRFNDVHVASEIYSAEPYIGERLKLGPAPELVVTETDIIRALMACQHTYMEKALFEAISTFMQPSEGFFSGAKHWKSMIDSCRPEKLPTIASQSWSRRWSLLFLENPDQKIGLSTWLLSVMDVIPPNFSNLSCSGLITDSESQTKMEIAFHRHLKTLAGPTLWSFPKSPPGYFDRHGLLKAANDLLSTSQGIILVGPDQDALRSLLRAISWNVNYCPQYQALGEIQGHGGRCFFPGNVSLQGGPGVVAPVFALTGNVPDGVGGPAWCIDSKEIAFQSLVAESLGFFQWLTDQDIDSKIRFVIMMTDDEWSTLVSEVPAVVGIPKLHVPCRDDRDLVPTLLAELPAIVDHRGCMVTLGLLLNFLYQTAQTNPEFLKGRHVFEFAGLIRPHDEDLGLLSSAPFLDEQRTPFKRLDSSRFPITVRDRFVQKMIAESGEFFARYVGDTADLEALISLYESVADLKDADPTPRVLGAESARGHTMPTSPAVSKSGSDQAQRHSPAELQFLARSYVEVVKDLPKPSASQTARFASFVAEAHSWYKKLPLYPKTPFFFYLDPTAGMKYQVNPNHETGGYYVDDDGKGIHYSDMTTRAYRENFGYWNYHVDSGSRMLGSFLRLKKGDEFDQDLYPEANIPNVNGQKLTPPPDLMLKGMAELSAFVHGDSSLHLWLGDVDALKLRTPFTFARTLDSAPKDLSMPLRLIWAFLNTPNWYSICNSDLLAPYQAYVSALAADASAPTSWHHEELLMQKAKQFGGTHLFEKVLFAVEIVRTIQSRSQAIEIHSGTSPADKAKHLVDHLVLERMGQLQTMKDAMNRFVENLG